MSVDHHFLMIGKRQKSLHYRCKPFYHSNFIMMQNALYHPRQLAFINAQLSELRTYTKSVFDPEYAEYLADFLSWFKSMKSEPYFLQRQADELGSLCFRQKGDVFYKYNRKSNECLVLSSLGANFSFSFKEKFIDPKNSKLPAYRRTLNNFLANSQPCTKEYYHYLHGMVMFQIMRVDNDREGIMRFYYSKSS